MLRAFAIAAHPDDIEFVMAGTLLQLHSRGWEIHYLNLSSGNLGSMEMSPTQTAKVRRMESKAAAKQLGAIWHPPICHDLNVFYDARTLRKLCSIIRKVDPSIILTHSPEDYMEDHMNTSRLTVTAAFARSMPSYQTAPRRQPASSPLAIYHANPHGLIDGLRRRIVPGAFVDTDCVHAQKRAALECHASQKNWLDATQGMNSYLVAMDQFSLQVGKLSQKFKNAEGWRRHSHLGFSPKDGDPLASALGSAYRLNSAYEKSLR